MIHGIRILFLALCSKPSTGWYIVEDISPLQAETFEHPAILCDAGSTGSRVFALHVPKSSNMSSTEPVVELIGRTTIGLAEFAMKGSFELAADSILPLLIKGITRLGPSAPIYIFATGGVRVLKNSIKDRLFASMRDDLGRTLADKHTGALSLRTVDGIDEALYGLLASNYLLGDVAASNLSIPLKDPIGVMDLGGSSLEVSLVGEDQIVGTSDDILVSYKSLGLTQFRERLQILDETGTCRFETGNGVACRELIRSLLHDDEDFRRKVGFPGIRDVRKFVGISAFVYAMDFAKWLMKIKLPNALSDYVVEFPNPSVTSMRKACDTICSLPLLDSLYRQHPFTSSKEAEGRCFDVCYIAEVLAALLDERHEERVMFFLFESRGAELEWTLGYYLKHHLTSVSPMPVSGDVDEAHGQEL